MKVNWFHSLIYTPLFSALFIIFTLTQIKLPFSPVPFTLQTLGVILAGVYLKPQAAFISIFIVIILALIGLPVFGGESGLTYILGSTGGFIFYFPFGALIISHLTHFVLNFDSNKPSKLRLVTYFSVVFTLFGLVMPYIFGIPWFINVLDVSFVTAMKMACYPYLIFDFVKIIIAVAVLITMKKTVLFIRLQQ
ncbi:MAG: biotin transporter BioY [Candidatus Pristimantibacillus lignocellulolyticus]|uniref:Biotin transporter n=1 Tax=Candidatus Pristimantibacillus lignocellulolyticus TaxID=2994561 RepID=A0A9J6ZBM4_9BACL|nr:MAG: biotin transporter BioY [Candidatus Pristimantibacillus lignocellulolyticus]